MRTIRITICGLCCVVLIILCTPIAQAQITHVFSFRNIYSAEGLKISLDQYQMDENGNRVVAQSKSVLPGEKVSYIPVITNKGAECYVRLRVRIEMDDKNLKHKLSLDDLYGLSSEWKKIGDYLYYTRKLKHGESVDVFRGIGIPYYWTQRKHESCGFTLYAIADAIQSQNYTPNFTSDAPWDSAVIRTGDDNMLRYWFALLICMMAVAIYSFWNRRG